MTPEEIESIARARNDYVFGEPTSDEAWEQTKLFAIADAEKTIWFIEEVNRRAAGQ